MSKTALSLLSALIITSSSAALAHTTDYTCTQIQTNYNGASQRFYNAVDDAYNLATEDSNKYQDFVNILAAAKEDYANGDHTYPTLKANYKGIDYVYDHKKTPSGTSGYMASMKEQNGSASTRVDQWKEANSNNPNNEACRQYEGCDLGSCTE